MVELRDGKAMVEAGGLKLLLPRDDLARCPPATRARRSRRRRAGGSYVEADLEASPEVDLRGLRVDELELRLGRALDAALLSGLPSFRIIHGKGMGALRARVAGAAAADPRVAASAPASATRAAAG